MFDQNGLIEIINNVAPVIASSPVIVKLFDCATDIIKTLYTPALTLKKAKRKLMLNFIEIKKIKNCLKIRLLHFMKLQSLKILYIP